MQQTRELRASTYEKPPVSIQARLQCFDRAARIRRAAKLALPLVAVSLMVLPIPGVHLSIPVLLAFAVVGGVRRLRQREAWLALEGSCPACRREQSFEVAQRPTLPLTLRCPSCSEFVKVERP